MRIRYSFKITLLAFVMMAVMCIYAWAQECQEKQYRDGVYEASNAILDVAVTIEEGSITNIEILEHRGGGKNYEEMAASLIDTIIQQQSTQVDAVTGATISSDSLKAAIDEALEKASISSQEE